MLKSIMAMLLVSAATWGAAEQATFEVATMKANSTLGPVGDMPKNADPSPGRFRMTDVPLRYILEWAYDLKDYQIDGPSWIIADNRYDIVAKAEGPATEEQMRPMLQALLIERLQMKVHRETRDLPVYVLERGKGPALLKQAPADEVQGIANENGRVAFHKFPLSRLTFMLTRRLDHPVIDLTGLQGDYDFSIDLSGLGFNGNPPADPTAPSVFTTIQEDMGLKLDSRKHPVEVLVIDHVEKVPKP
jgi:uncharacterized protein (TIGR03435 family)